MYFRIQCFPLYGRYPCKYSSNLQSMKKVTKVENKFSTLYLTCVLGLQNFVLIYGNKCVSICMCQLLLSQEYSL